MLLFIILSGQILLKAWSSPSYPSITDPGMQDPLQAGVVIDTVYCRDYPDQSYSLVLPSFYDPGKRWPVVFVFEPGARGSLAAGIFRQASERFGLIIMCSNNSSNRSHSGSLRAAEAMFNEANQRFEVDTSMLFVAGFSGGSRVASNLALENPFIKGVIGCGAGMYHNKKTHPQFRDGFCYYGIIGLRDMNLQDMIDTEERLSRQKVVSHIQYIEIQHVWPPPEEITAAVAWLKYMIDSTDHDARDYFLAFQAENVTTMEEQDLLLDAAVRLESVIPVFHGSGFQGQLDRLKADKIYSKQVRQRNRALNQELALQTRYLDALTMYVFATPLRPDTVHTLQWWTGEIKIVKSWKDSRSIETSRLASRLLYLLEVHFDEEIEKCLENRQQDKAGFLADLWIMVAPDQLWSQWNVARVYAICGEEKEALGVIEKIVRSGDAKFEWFRDAVEFESLRDDPDYMRLMESLIESAGR